MSASPDPAATPEWATPMPKLWRPCDLVKYFQNEFTEKTFANWRAAGIGPPFVKAGTRVFYRPEAVQKWAKDNERPTAGRVA